MPKSRVDLSSVQGQLDNWRLWMIHGSSGPVGLPPKSLGFASGAVHFEDLVQAADLYAARATDALVRDLPPLQRAAIEHRWLHTWWRYQQHNIDHLLEAAYVALAAGMSKKGLL